MSKNRKRFKSVFGNLAQGAKDAGKNAAQGAKGVSDVAVNKSKTAGSSAARRMKSAGEAGARLTGETTTQAGEAARNAASRGIRNAGDRIDGIRERVSWDSALPGQAQDSLLATIESSKSLSGDAKRNLTAQVGRTLDGLPVNQGDVQAQAFVIIQGLLASDQISREINGWMQSLVKGAVTKYDQAMDAGALDTGAGNYHRLFDGGHTLPGAFQAVRGALPNDSIFQEAAGLLQALARDATTPRGLPLVNWDKGTFDSLASSLENVGISRLWLNDLVSYDAVELIAGSIGILAVALNWNTDDVEEFSGMVSGMGLSAVVSANPLLLIVTVVALARSFHLARKSGDWKEFADGLAKGGVCTGAVLLVTGMVSGPAVVILLSGICVGILANQATKNVSFVEIGQFMVREIREATSKMGSVAALPGDTATSPA